MLKKTIAITTVVSLCLLIILLNVTSPSTSDPFEILIIFIFAYLLSLGLVTFFIFGVSYLVSRLSVVFAARRPTERLNFKRSYYYSTIVALAPVMLIGLQSVGVVNVYEILLICLFVIIGCLYISKKIY